LFNRVQEEIPRESFWYSFLSLFDDSLFSSFSSSQEPPVQRARETHRSHQFLNRPDSVSVKLRAHAFLALCITVMDPLRSQPKEKTESGAMSSHAVLFSCSERKSFLLRE
jgi:hypothetical protein